MSSQPTAAANFGELLLAGFRLFQISIKDIIAVVALQVVTMTTLLLLTVSILLNLMAGSTQNPPGYGTLAVIILAVLVICSICLIFPVAYIKKFQGHLNGETFRSKTALLHSLTYLKNILLWFIIYAVNILYLLFINSLAQHTVLLLPLAIPGFIFLVSLSMGPFLIVVEEHGPIEAIKQSYLLIRGRWWRTALYLIIATIITILIYLAISIPFSFIFAIISGANPMLIGALGTINTLLFCSLLPLFIALIFPFFCELKRKQVTA